MSDTVTKRIRSYQAELFDAFDEFFRGVTGTAPDNFQGFSDLAVSTWETFVTRFNEAAEALESRLVGLYNEHRHRQFDDARALRNWCARSNRHAAEPTRPRPSRTPHAEELRPVQISVSW